MREITVFNQRPFVGRIVSKPGDVTHYDYILIENINRDRIYSVPFKNSFEYPTFLDPFDAMDVAMDKSFIDNRKPTDTLIRMSKNYDNVSILTIYEVCCAIAEINEKGLI